MMRDLGASDQKPAYLKASENAQRFEVKEAEAADFESVHPFASGDARRAYPQPVPLADARQRSFQSTLACRVARPMQPLLESQQNAQRGKPNGNFTGFAGDVGLSCVQSARDLA